MEKFDLDCPNLQKKIEELEAIIRGKDNEIAILETRIKFLKQFEPKKKEPPLMQG